MTTVALSIESGAQGRTFAVALACSLGVQLADCRAMERNVAMRSDFGRGKVELLEGACGRFAANWTIREEDLAARLREETLETAARGNILIVGWSAAAILRPLRHVACVSVRASRGYRAATIQGWFAFPQSETALLEVESEDALITRFVRRMFSADWRDPDLYDLVVDGEGVTVSLTRRIIEQLTKNRRYQENDETRATVDAQLSSLQCRQMIRPRLTGATPGSDR